MDMMLLSSVKKCLLLILQPLLLIVVTSKETRIVYEELPPGTANSSLPNPERGFYKEFKYFSSNPKKLSTESLNSLRNNLGRLTVILRIYYLNTFLSKSLSEDFLNDFEADMKVLRDSGTKAILRFAYAECINSYPQEAKIDKMLEHIQDLKRILQSNIDVIMSIQAGFFGTGGKWHSSTNFGNIDKNEWDNRSRVVDALLDAVPSSRYIQIQTPPQKKQKLTGENAPLNENTAHSGSKVARLGFHNDCFLNPSLPKQGTKYHYLKSESQFTIMGGETCKDKQPKGKCPIALEEMKLFSFTYMNSVDNPPPVFDSPSEGNCTEEIFDRLGYRIVLKHGTYDNQIYSGEQRGMNFDLTLKNVGFAAPITSRNMDIILKNKVSLTNPNDPSRTTNHCLGTVESFDLLNLYADKEVDVKVKLRLPSSVDPGYYDLFIKFPDIFAGLSTKKEYNVAVANVGINDFESGLIKLSHEVQVLSGVSSGMGSEENIGENREIVNLLCAVDGNGPSMPTPTSSPQKYTVHPLKNGNFEGNFNSWMPYDNGYTIDSTHRSGSKSIKVLNDGGCYQNFEVQAQRGSKITLSGWSKSFNVSSSIEKADYGIYADVYFEGGTHLWGQIAGFKGGNHDWQYSKFTFMIEKTTKSIMVHVLYRNDSSDGVVYFDDIDVAVSSDNPIVTSTPPSPTTNFSPIKKHPLLNGNFEGSISEINSKWKTFHNGYEITTKYYYSGKQSIEVKNGGGARQIILDFGMNNAIIPSKSNITISGWSKASNIYPRIKHRNYAIYADITYLDDSNLWGCKAHFRGGTHDWEHSEYTFKIEKPMKKMAVIALYRNDPEFNGTAYFDKVDVEIHLGETSEEALSRSLLRGHDN